MNIFTPHCLRLLEPFKLVWKTNGVVACLATINKCESLDPPRKPLTPYFRFMNEIRPNMHQKHPDFSVAEILRHIADEWKELKPEQKKPYQEMYAEEIAKFRTLEEKWWTALTAEQKQNFRKYKNDSRQQKILRCLKKKLKLLGKPQKSVPAFLLFASQQAKQSEHSEKDFDFFLQQWKSLSAEDKQSYLNTAKKNLSQYNNQHYAWEFRMMKEGRGHLLRQINMEQRIFLSKKK